MNKLTIIFLMVILLYSGGCGTINRSSDDKYFIEKNNIFSSVKFDLAMIKEKYNAPKSSYQDIFQITLMTVLTEFSLFTIDLPFSIVTDTVCIPYDIHDYIKKSNALTFWNNITNNQIIDKPFSYYKKHFIRVAIYCNLI